jgi:hypothetical protein
MADQEGPTPKVLLPVPPGYHELPEDERPSLAEVLAAQLQPPLCPPGLLRGSPAHLNLR